MKGISKVLLFAGIILVAYAIFSRFYGEPSVALKRLSSMGVLIAANTLILISIALNQFYKE